MDTISFSVDVAKPNILPLIHGDPSESLTTQKQQIRDGAGNEHQLACWVHMEGHGGVEGARFGRRGNAEE